MKILTFDTSLKAPLYSHIESQSTAVDDSILWSEIDDQKKIFWRECISSSITVWRISWSGSKQWMMASIDIHNMPNDWETEMNL